MKAKSIRAAIQMMLPEVEEMLSLGVPREDAFKAVSERFGIEIVNIRSFDTALYRARQKKIKTPRVERQLVRGREDLKKEEVIDVENEKNIDNKGIIGKEFFDEIKDSFDPNKFLDKY